MVTSGSEYYSQQLLKYKIYDEFDSYEVKDKNTYDLIKDGGQYEVTLKRYRYSPESMIMSAEVYEKKNDK
jgi:hypothetical protein